MEAGAPGPPAVRLDSAAGAAAVMAPPLGLGHRRIGRIAAPFERRAFDDREARWRAALTDAGIDPDAMPYARSEINFHAAKEAARGLLEDAEPPTAIFCDDDILAGGVYLAARELERRIPRDVSVVGFDDPDFTPLLDPPPTTRNPHPPRARAGAVEAPPPPLAGEKGPR